MKVKILSTTLLQLIPENDAEAAILTNCNSMDSCYSFTGRENEAVEIEPEEGRENIANKSLMINFKDNDE